jgi:hypothetical protein
MPALPTPFWVGGAPDGFRDIAGGVLPLALSVETLLPLYFGDIRTLSLKPVVVTSETVFVLFESNTFRYFMTTC